MRSIRLVSPKQILLLGGALLLTIPTATIAAEPASDENDWPLFGRDHANSVNASSESAIGPDTVGGLVERWRIGDIASVTGTPAVVNGIVYFGDWTGSVFAVNAADGSIVWQARPGDGQITSSVAVTGDDVLAADLRGWMRALDRETGELRWEAHLQPPDASAYSSPVVIGDTVVIGLAGPDLGPGGGNGFRASIVALDVDDGEERWRVFSDAGTDDPDTWVSIWSSASYDPDLGLVYIGTGNTNTMVNGRHSNSLIDDDHANAVMAIDHASGEIAWVSRLVEVDEGRDFDIGAAPNLFTLDGLAVVGVGSKGGDYSVLDRRTGEILWQADLTSGGAAGGVMSTAAIDEGVIYLASNDGFFRDGRIIALDAVDGTVLWQRAYEYPVLGGSMALANGVVFRGMDDGLLVALASADGEALWSADLGAEVRGGVSVSDGAIFIGYGSGNPPRYPPGDGGVVAFALR